jgi:hypothetical protein
MDIKRTLAFDLEGIIDPHIHTGPDHSPRAHTDIEAARAAAHAGMRAIGIKSHHTLTADRAAIAESIVDGIRVFGGLTLNASVGGLNSAAVENALSMGAKVIWMPTQDAAHHRRIKGKSGGISILDTDGNLCSDVFPILDLVRQSGAVLATGHLAPQESARLITTAVGMGVQKIVVTHPESGSASMPLSMQQALSKLGVFFERCYLHTTKGVASPVSIAEIAAHIRSVGIASTILATDFGRADLPNPVAGMQMYLEALLNEGFTRRELHRMAGSTPADVFAL